MLKIALLSNNNEIFFCYNWITLSTLEGCAKNLAGFKIQNKEEPLGSTEQTRSKPTLALLINNKLIFIKTIQSFINLTPDELYQLTKKKKTFLIKNPTNNALLLFYKEDSKKFTQLFKELSTLLSCISPNWYIQNSIAPIAFDYLKKHVKEAKYTLYTNQALFELLKENFFGGRNELFARGIHEEVTLIDYKGLYNRLLLLEYPVGDPTFITQPSDISAPGFYCVKVSSTLATPLLPRKEEGKVIYKNGTFTGVFWHEELQLFKKYGGQILNIEYGLIYKSQAFVFKDFAETCLKKRASINPLERLLYKIIANAALGYLGFYSKNSQHQVYRNIAVPVVVAARGRIAWYEQYQKLTNTHKQACVYADTDSFFIKNMSQDVQIDPAIFNIEKLRFVIFFEKKKYIAQTQSGINKYVGIASNLTVPTALTYATDNNL